MENLGLDVRLTKGLQKMGIEQPTPVQAQTIPVALQGTDLILKSKTGSGKTFAFLLPMLQRLLRDPKPFSALVLVPTKELAKQTAQVIGQVTKYCTNICRSCNLSGIDSFQMQRSQLADLPFIVISTPSRIIPHLEAKSLVLKDSLEMLVIDEADLVVSFGYKEDLNRIMGFMPNFCQTILISATLTPEIEHIQQLLLKAPVTIKVEEDADSAHTLEQFSIKCKDEKEKFLILYVIFKLKLIKGKCIVFVNEVNASYKVKLFLEQFGIKACILNPELPVNSRYHIVEEFNKGVYDIIIASDSASNLSLSSKNENAHNREASATRPEDKEYSAARGLDFRHVDCVINFDIPQIHDMLVHRVGRTARGNDLGTAFCLFTAKEEIHFEKLSKREQERGFEIRPYAFDFGQVDSFRYRMEDALANVSKGAIRQARIKEIREQILRSDRLKTHFAQNPNDLEALRHDKPIRPFNIQKHMKHVPDYLLKSIKVAQKLSLPVGNSSSVGFYQGKRRMPADSGSKPKKLLDKMNLTK